MNRRLALILVGLAGVLWASSGVAVQDFGHIEEGDKVSCSVTVLADGWETIKGYWDNRTLVNISDEAGVVWSNMRVVVKSYEYVPHFPHAVKATLEFWRL